MSWIFGEIVKKKNSFTDLLKVSNKILYSFSNEKVNIVSGGN